MSDSKDILPRKFFRLVLRDNLQKVLMELPVTSDLPGGLPKVIVATMGRRVRAFVHAPREHEETSAQGMLPEYPLLCDYDEAAPVMRIDIPVPTRIAGL